jgi:WS/DGAT/MGAT family acyltransferase
MSGRTMGPVDTIWLNMDRPDNLMVIDSLMLFDGPADWDRLRSVLQRRLVDRYPVFRQHPVHPLNPVAMPRWEDDDDFDLERHIVRTALDRPDDETLGAYVDSQTSRPFDDKHPLWECHFIDDGPGGSVAYLRIHHAIADGIALISVLVSLTDAEPGADLAEAAGDAVPVPPRGIPAGSPVSGLVGGAARFTASATEAAGDLAKAAVGAALDLPRHLGPHSVVDALTFAGRTGKVASKLLLSPTPRGPLTGHPRTRKRAVWSTPFPLRDVKRVGRASGATVNDVLLGAVAGALRTYQVEHGSKPADLTTMVPVNVRDLSTPLPPELGNEFALVLFSYPCEIAGPLERVAESHRRMEEIKSSPEAALTFGLIGAIGRSGKEMERFLVDFFAGKAVGVTTNVPGPRERRYIAGSLLTGVLAWVPGSGHHTLGVSIVTYADEVRVGFKVDAARIPDPEALVEAFEDEVDTLSRVAAAVRPA